MMQTDAITGGRRAGVLPRRLGVQLRCLLRRRGRKGHRHLLPGSSLDSDSLNFVAVVYLDQDLKHHRKVVDPRER